MLPPRVAPLQVVIVYIAKAVDSTSREAMSNKADDIAKALKDAGVSISRLFSAQKYLRYVLQK